MQITNRSLRMFFRSNEREIRFVALFITFFLAGNLLLQLSYTWVSPVLITFLHAEVSAHLIGLVEKSGNVTVQGGNTLVSGGEQMKIDKGCDGSEGLLLIAAAVCAFPATRRRKLHGLLWGFGVVYILNILRIMSLFFSLHHAPRIFDIMHIYIGQTFIIIAGVLFFLWWAMDNEKTS